MNVKISKGNSKLGPGIPNISLIPVKDCGNCEHCKADCYALKAWTAYKQTRAAWRSNSAAFRADPWAATAEVDKSLSARKTPPTFFRIHVAGDFLNQDHVDAWFWLARKHPSTRFLAFTKMHRLDYTLAPGNLQIVLSMWPGMHNPIHKHLPRAWLAPDDRIPDTALPCPGGCDSCGFCWNLSSINRDVYFEKH